MTNHINPVNDLILLFSLTFALYHIGHIWPFQVVLFPLWRRVGAKEFPAYHQAQFRGIFGVIFVPLGLSALSAILLCFFPPQGTPRWLLGAGVALQAILLLSLFYWIPLQLRFRREGNLPVLIRELVNVHWTRVANLTLFAMVVLWIAWIRLQG
jgi:hypothetical protein